MTSTNNLIKTFKTIEGKISIYDSGLVESYINEGAYIDTAYLIEGKKRLMKVYPNMKFYVLAEGLGFFRISKEAKELAAGKEYSDHLAAVAVISNHVATNLILDAYQKINKPVVPTKIFTDRELAIEWLRKMNSNI